MSVFSLVTSTKAITAAQKALLERLHGASDEQVTATVGYPGGSDEMRVSNLTDHGIWFAGGDVVGPRFWNVFGIGTMKRHGIKPIICEINPPVSGVSGRCGGAFVADRNGRVALASRGRIGGGRTGIGKVAFQKHYEGKWVRVRHEGKDAVVVFVDFLDSQDLVERIADYVFAVSTIKGKIAGSGEKDHDAGAALLAHAAATGNTTGLSAAEKEGLKKLKENWVYERSAKNRRLALARWGNACRVCEMRFDKYYGASLARGFIEFHHLRPIALGPRTTNPAKDLVPLCSNCHSMAHQRRPVPIPISQLRKALAQHSGA
ncbi:MAG: HNH endonuclease [Elusimicrobia bacterium]|nr:HNH endonuclease [Elusimicrobiota bacterium]